MKASQILATWLSRGDCNRRTSNTFYSLVQAVNSHVRRLMADKAQHDEELAQMKLKFRLRMEGILRQCKCQIIIINYAGKGEISRMYEYR